MKTVLSFVIGGIFILLTSSTNVTAQGWEKTVLIDTTLVRAMVVTIESGQRSDTHSHPANFFYALTDGKLVVHYTDGKDETLDLKAGDAIFTEPERPHVTENVGGKPVKFLLVELKEHPYNAPMKKK